VLPGGGIEFSVPNAPAPVPTQTAPAPRPSPPTPRRSTGPQNPLDFLPGGSRIRQAPGTATIVGPRPTIDYDEPTREIIRRANPGKTDRELFGASIPQDQVAVGDEFAFVPGPIIKPVPLPVPVKPGPIPAPILIPSPSNPPGGDRIFIPRPGESAPVDRPREDRPILGPPEMKGPVDTRERNPLPPARIPPQPSPTPRRQPVPIMVPPPAPVQTDEPERRDPRPISGITFGQGYYTKRYPTRKVRGTGNG
jgi:hypothetical protein